MVHARVPLVKDHEEVYLVHGQLFYELRGVLTQIKLLEVADILAKWIGLDLGVRERYPNLVMLLAHQLKDFLPDQVNILLGDGPRVLRHVFQKGS